MISNLEYALMAGNAYRTTRGEVNQIPIPEAQGWHEVLNSHIGYSTTGFEAISFQWKRGQSPFSVSCLGRPL